MRPETQSDPLTPRPAGSAGDLLGSSLQGALPWVLSSPGPSVSQLSGAPLWQHRNRAMLEQKKQQKAALSLSDPGQEQRAGPEKSPVLSLCPSPAPSSVRGGGHDTAPACTPQHHRHAPRICSEGRGHGARMASSWGILRGPAQMPPPGHLGRRSAGFGTVSRTGQKAQASGAAPGFHVASLSGPQLPQLPSSL